MNKLKATLLLVGLCLGLFLTAGCGGSQKDDGKTSIVCTTAMIGDMVSQIATSNEVVEVMMQGSVDPHLYKPTPGDIADLNRADIVFLNGLHLEGKMGEILETLESKGKTIVAVAETIPEDKLVRESDADKAFDPHTWMSVETWTEIIPTLVETLATAHPERKADYEANAAALKQELGALEAYVKKSIGAIPPERRILVTAHDAFAYFGRDYGLDVEGIQGISTDDEAGIQRINELVDLLVSKKISAIFVESTVPPKQVEALREGAASKGQTVAIGGELFSDAMGTSGTYEGTYLGMIDHNATIVARALAGPDAAPKKGRLGKLSHN